MGLPNKSQTIPINYITDYYEGFLNRYSLGTSKNYKTDLKIFFNVAYGKDAKHVTVDDIKGTKMKDVIKFHNYLTETIVDKDGNKKPRYKNASYNRKINAVKSFFQFLTADTDVFYEINMNMFRNLEKRDTDLDSESYDSLDWQEAISIWEYASTHFNSESDQLSMLFKLATITSIRLEALINCSWEVDWFTKIENGNEVNYIKVKDKGKINLKPISPAFYKELRDKLGTTGRLFPTLHPHKVGAVLSEILDALNFDKRRNIKFHSFKKTGIMRVLDKTGDMYKAKQQGNHSSISTTEKYYIKYKECLTDAPSYTIDDEVDILDELTNVSKDAIVEALSKMSDSAKYEFMRALKKDNQ